MIGQQFRISVRRAPNQDALCIGVIRYDPDGKQYYAKDFVWEEFQPMELMATPTFPGADSATVEIHEWQQRVVR